MRCVYYEVALFNFLSPAAFNLNRHSVAFDNLETLIISRNHKARGSAVGAGVDALPLLLCVTMRVGAGVFDALAMVGFAVTVLSAIILVVVSSSAPAKILPPCLDSGVSDALV